MCTLRDTKKLALKEVEGRLVGYSSDSKSYRVYNPVTRCIIESRNVIFIETPSRLLPPPSEGPQLLMQELPPGDDPDRDSKGHNYITDDDFLRDLRNYKSVVDHPGSASTDHVTASRRSENTLVAELLGRISAITPQDLLKDDALPGEASLTGEVPEQPTSPNGRPVEAPFEGSSSLQQHGQSHHGMTPVVTRAGNAAHSLRELSANDSAHLAEFATNSTLSESSGDWDYIPRYCSRMSCTRQTKQSRLWSMPVLRPTFEGIRWGRKWKLFRTSLKKP